MIGLLSTKRIKEFPPPLSENAVLPLSFSALQRKMQTKKKLRHAFADWISREKIIVILLLPFPSWAQGIL